MTQTLSIAVDRLIPNPEQPRQQFDEAGLQELAASILEHGILQPLLVYHDDAHGYILIAGERRLRAAKIAGLGEVPCLVQPAPTAQQSLEIALIENLQRENLSPADEARAYQQLHDLGLTDEAIGQRVGKARSTITNMRRLAELPPAVLDKVGDGEQQLPLRYARSLIPVARLDPQLAGEIAIEVAGTAVDERQEEYGSQMGEFLAKQGKSLINAYFDAKWNPKAEAEIDGVTQPLPACLGCEAYLKIDFDEYCARPACFAAKQQHYAGLELKKAAKATGVAIAQKGEQCKPLPSDPKNPWKISETAQKLLATKHASLRLKAGSKDYTSGQITGSAIVHLLTTDPEALAQAAGFKAVADRPTSSGQGREDYAQQRAAHQAAEERITQALALAAPAFDKIWPGNVVLLRKLCDLMDYVEYLPDDLNDKVSAKQPAAAALKRYLTHALLSEVINLPYPNGNALVARKPVEQLAHELKVKLPKGWEVPLTPPKPEAKPAAEKKPAAKAKAAPKKPAAKKPTKK